MSSSPPAHRKSLRSSRCAFDEHVEDQGMQQAANPTLRPFAVRTTMRPLVSAEGSTGPGVPALIKQNNAKTLPGQSRLLG